MTARQLSVPLYQRIFGILSQRIRDGSYAADDQLPSIDALSAEFGVSRGTIRQAIGELAARDLLVREQGRGTYINKHAAQESRVSSAGSFADLVLLTLDLPLRDVTVDRDEPLPPRIRRLLKTETSQGTVMRRIREIDDSIFAYTVQYLAPDFDSLSDPEQWNRFGLLTILHNQGVVFSRADQSMSAKIADVEVAERLGVDLGAPVLYAERVVHSDRGPVEVVCAWYRADLFSWHTTLDIKQVADKISFTTRTDLDVPVDTINVVDPSSPPHS